MLQLETIDNAYSFHSYDNKSAKVIKPDYNIHSNQPLENALLQTSTTTLIYKDQMDTTSFPKTFMEFDHISIENLIQYPADIYLIGTGSTPCFPNKELLQSIAQKKLPIDFMTTGAACRTFNILTSEYRNVAILIFFE